MTQAFEIMEQDNGILTQSNGTDFDNPNEILTQSNGMVFGYARVSTKEQNSARQKEALQDKCNVYFEDKLSGRNMKRPEFQKMMEQLRPGDTVMVVSIDRLGRNLKELVELSSQLKEMGVNIIALNQGIDTSSKVGQLFYNFMALMADMEIMFIHERQREGIELAKKEGRYKGRPLKKLDEWEQISKEVAENKLSVERACQLLKISRSTFYRRKKFDQIDF
mgnify:FL=1